MNAKEWIRRLGLRPHPEGGFYRETYRAKARVRLARGVRPVSTAIFFLLRRGEVSLLHRIRSDEMWHFHGGGPLTVVEITEEGRLQRTVLGPDPRKGHRLQHVVPVGRWFGAFPNARTAFALVGCTVAPGFDFKDFEIAGRAKLLKRYPRLRGTIVRLT